MGSITDVKVWPLKNTKPGMKIKANGMFIYDGAFKLKFSLFQGSQGMFVSFPGKYGEKKDTTTGKNIFYPDIKCMDDNVRTQLNAAAIAEYNKATGNDNMDQGEAPGPTNQTSESDKKVIPF